MNQADPVVSRLLSTTDSSEWEYVDSLELDFEADHPQGLLRIGDDRFFLSSVRFTRTESGSPDHSIEGQGFLIEVKRDGRVVREKHRLPVGAGLIYHPGGLATDGEHIY
ncbi:MAG TPA: DUF6454 family protein, partial [Dehalococcoidia bacterium]|nr:DUF6454 family protein [Dehalococcoidia bacterium]